ncbi:hypothetical protein ACWDX6_23835 [Streptomyces sp. NPDC003027]
MNELTIDEIIGTRTNVKMVFERCVRSVVRSSYDPATRTLTDVVRGEYYARAHIGYIGREENGTWTLFTVDGAPIKAWLNNKVSAKVAAQRHFGPVFVA